MKSSAFPRLFAPGRIGSAEIRNRVVMLPMGTAYASVIGEVTDKTIDHYAERAKGGVGLEIVGNCSPFGRIGVNQLVLDADWFMAGHYELVEAVHAEGAAICLQLNHPGRQAYPALLDGRQPVSSSDIPCSFLGEYVYPTPRALEVAEIYEIMDRWSEAAGRAKKVGYDAIELHGAHGYLIEQFMSPCINRRSDEFGGSLENRMRFPLELIRRVRRVVGERFPIGFRFAGEEFVTGGITLKDSPDMARMLEAAGVAYLNVTAGIFDTIDTFNDPMRRAEGWKHYIWKTIKQAVNIPVIAGGLLRTPAFCESLLEEGKADFTGLARPLLADAHWARKAREGTVDDICLCISCLECAHPSTRRRQGGGARRCSVNAATGRERQFIDLRPAAVLKKVMVIGGGPAGMEAARVAAQRGHQVILYDKADELGGALRLACVPPGKDKIGWLSEYLKVQLHKAKVQVRLGVEVTPALVKEVSPDAVVIATGASPVMPSWATGENAVTAADVLSGKTKIANRKVVIVGAGMAGLETAEYLAHSGNEVTVIDMVTEPGAEMGLINRHTVLQALKEADVKLLMGKEVVGLEQGGVLVKARESGDKTIVEADLVVLALGYAPNKELAEALAGTVDELHTIGDCNEPRVIMEAIYEGARVGSAL